MSQNLAIFEFQETPVRIFGSANKPMFAAADVCRVLGIVNSRDAIAGLDEDEKGVDTAYTLGGNQTIGTDGVAG